MRMALQNVQNKFKSFKSFWAKTRRKPNDTLSGRRF